jgi:outer membrane immunogenic protein
MKKILLPILLGLAFAVSRLFAGPEPLPSGKEMKSVVQPVVQENCNWTGFYIGAHIGYAGGDLTWKDTDVAGIGGEDQAGPTTLVDHSQSGFIAGGQLGGNYQWRWLVLGAEGSFSYSDVRAHTVKDIDDEPNIFDTRNEWLGTIAGRVGFAWNRFLLYAKGGVAFANLRYSWLHVEEFDPVDTFKTDEWRTGALVGGGIEYAINCNWSAKIEYNHLFLGTDNIDGTRIDGGVPEHETFQVDLNQDSLQAGLNYKFLSFGGHNSPSLTFAGVERLDAKSSKEVLQPAIEEPCKWTGFYIGANAGYAGGDLSWVDADTAGTESGEVTGPETLTKHGHSGFIGGGQLGYNHQFGSWLVLGVEGTFDYSDVKGSSVRNTEVNTDAFETRDDWIGTIAGRVGFAWNKVLFYAKGGGAFVNERYSWRHGTLDDETVDPFTANEVRTVGMVGGGLEYAITCHWSAKVEYNHLFLGSEDVSGTRIDSGVPETETYRIDIDHDSVQAGLNYKF